MKKIIYVIVTLVVCVVLFEIFALQRVSKTVQMEEDKLIVEDKPIEDKPIEDKPIEDKPLEEQPIEEQVTTVSMVFAGDVLFSEHVLASYEREGLNGILENTLIEAMKNADIAMVNQEFPFSNRGTQAPDKQYTFRINPEKIGIFNEFGIDIVSLANNHSLDYGIEALEDTFTTLEEAQIRYVGAGVSKERAKQLEILAVSDKKIGFLAASRVIPVPEWNVDIRSPGVFTTYDPTSLLDEIKKSKEVCDYTVVYVHWGIERNNQPEEYQKNMAKQYIDAGADIVIGSHPHVLQGIEFYNGKPIVYSLGNFIFGSSIASTVMLKVEVDADNRTALQLVACTGEGGQTKSVEGEAAIQIYEFVESISFNVTIDEMGQVLPQE